MERPSPAPQDTAAILVFRTMPDGRNSNVVIERAFSSALTRIARPARVLRSAVETTLDAITMIKPRLIIGIGSIAFDDVDYASIWRAARSVEAPLVYWLHDDPYEFDFHWKLLNRCNWIFTTDRGSVDYYSSQNVSHLPLAADVDRHFCQFVPLQDRATDVFFCGVAYPNRRSIVTTVRDVLRSCQTVINGEGWDERLPFCRNKRIPAEALIDAYASARVVLNFGRDFNIANERFEIVSSTPGPRTFEAAAAGCVQAMFLDSCEIFDFFVKDTEILTFSTVHELAEIVEGVRKYPEHYDGIALAAQAKTLAQHTYDHRAETLLNILQAHGLFSLPVISG